MKGDGPRVVRCWKFMLLHWRHAKHAKYSLEALHLIGVINATATEHIAFELVWYRFINTRGVPGGNRPVDLAFESYFEGLPARTWSQCITSNYNSNI